MPDQNDNGSADGPRFKIPLPGGRVARVPIEVLEKYADATAVSVHGTTTQATALTASAAGTPQQQGGGMITINIYADKGNVAVERHDAAEQRSDEGDVVAHSLSVDPATGTSDWHTDWEFGECEYTDETGFPQMIQAWHRHPFGTEYTELYEG